MTLIKIMEIATLKRLLAAAFLIFSSFHSLQSKGNTDISEDHVFFMLFITEMGNPDLADVYTMERLQLQYPETKFIPIHESSAEKMKEALAHHIGPRTIVDGIFINSHGNNSYTAGSGTSLSSAEVNMRYNPIIGSSLAGSEFLYKVNGDNLFKDVFQPVVGRFSKGAKIIFSGCIMLNKGSAKEKLYVLRRVAELFGLQDGEIYMNSTLGFTFTDRIARQNISGQPDNVSRIKLLASQIAAPVLYPISWDIERHILNRGYSVRIRKDSFTLYKNDLFNALESKYATGESLGEALANLKQEDK